MAYSYVLTPGDGTRTVFSFAFGYLSRSHISVAVNGVNTSFNWLSDFSIQVLPAPAAGTMVQIKRLTPKDEPIVDYADGSVLTEQDLDISSLFALYCAQETQDSGDRSIQKNPFGLYDALSGRVINVADPVSNQDAANKKSVDAVDTALRAIAAANDAAIRAIAANNDSAVRGLIASKDSELRQWAMTSGQSFVAQAAALASSVSADLSGYMTDYATVRAYTGSVARVFITGVYPLSSPSGIAGEFVRDDTDSTSTDDGGTTLVASNGKRWKRQFAGPVSAEWFGWPARDADAMNDAINAAQRLKAGFVRFRTPCLALTKPIVLRSGVVIDGPGSGPEGEIRTANGVAIDAMIQTDDFENQYATRPGSVANGVTINAGFKNLYLNGNRANVPAVTDWRKGMGHRCYWMSPVIENVRVSHTSGIGGISAYPANNRVFPPGYQFVPNFDGDIKESYIDKVSYYDTMYEGFIFEGPSDLEIRTVFCGWPANGLAEYTYNSAKKSLKFTTGGIVGVRMLTKGAGYTNAAVSITGGGGSGFTGQAVIVGGQIDRILVDTDGYGFDRATATVTITGDGSGATAVAHVDDTIDGVVFNNDGAEIGFVHSFNNPHGWNVNFRNDSAGFARIKGAFIMGETGWGNVKIGGHTRYQIARVDTHGAGFGGGPSVFPSMLIRSDRGGSIASWEDYRAALSDYTANGAPSLLLDGVNNRIDNGTIFGRGQAGDGVVIRGRQNAATFSASGIAWPSAALVTEQGGYSSEVDVLSDSNYRAWSNRQASYGFAGHVRVNNGGHANGTTQFEGLDAISPNQWRLVDIISRSTAGGLTYSKQTVTGTASPISVSEQTIVIPHSIVRTPGVKDCSVSLYPADGVTMGIPEYYYVSDTTATNLTVKVKFNTFGSGSNSVIVKVDIK